MLMLMLHTFLLLLAAFLAGAALSCVTKRTLYAFSSVPDEVMSEPYVETVPPPVAASPQVSAGAPAGATREDTQRFGRALAGDVTAVAAAAAASARGVPVIEVQALPPEPPRPAPQPVPQARVEATQPAPPPEADDQTYFGAAIASHDGSALPPEAIHEAVLPPPAMPEPRAEPLPVPSVAIPEPVRPEDAPDDPDRTYVEEALAATGGLRELPATQEPADDIALTSYDEAAVFDDLPKGKTYAGVATGADLSSGPAAVPTAGEDEDAAPAPFERSHVASAVAVAAGIAAQRAAEQKAHEPVRAAGPDDLTRINGVDEVLASRLAYAGVTRFAQVAAWTDEDVYRMSQTLGYFGRVQYENWIEQARILAGGGDPRAAFERRVAPATTLMNAAESASAAAAAAAAAMAVTASVRRPAPVAQTVAASPTVTVAPAAAVDQEPNGGTTARDLAALRSVRSEALRPDFVPGNLDDLKRIRGIGVLIEKKLNSLGITSYEQVANWSGADIDRISRVLDFKGRIERENWIEQARILASGGQTEFSRRVDKGEE